MQNLTRLRVVLAGFFPGDSAIRTGLNTKTPGTGV